MSDLAINRTPELIAAEINNIKNQTRKMVLYNSIEIGRRLMEAKQLVHHGQWGSWLEESVDYSQRTANNLMKIFEEYGADQMTLLGDNIKSQALANLNYTQAVALLGIPEEEREQFVKSHDLDNMSTRELQQVIKERDEAVKKMQDAESEKRVTEQVLRETQADVKNLQEAVKREKEAAKQEIERLQKSIDEGIALRESYLKQVDQYKTLLEEAKSSGNSSEVEKLQIALTEAQNMLEGSNKKVEELEAQLKEKPIETTVATIEKIPEEIEKELQELREKARLGGTEEKFKVYFDELVKGFSKLLGVLAEIEEADEEAHGKYKNAVGGLLSRMAERL